MLKHTWRLQRQVRMLQLHSRRKRHSGGTINDAVNAEGRTALFIAVRDNNLAKVEELLAAGADVNKPKRDGMTPLYAACYLGYIDIIAKLIAAGADINKTHSNSSTPLYLASELGSENIVDQLIAAGADVNKATILSSTPLYIASHQGHVNVVEKLIDAGADINKSNKNDTTPLFVASQNGHSNAVDKLISGGADVNKAKTDSGSTALYIACEKGYLQLVDKLIAANADLNKANNNGSTPLFIASQYGYLEIVERLITADVDINKSKNNGVTPLFIGSQYGHFKIVERLLTAGADANKTTDNAVSPLYVACEKSHIQIIKLLLNVPGIDKTTVIDAANEAKYSDEITELVLGEQTLWQGWTRSDVERMNEIFDEAAAPNISLCPVCLKTTTRDKGCMHMKHNCKGLSGFYHKRLYDIYNTNNEIHWCTICGRIGYGIGTHFEHYRLGLAKGEKPGTHGATMVFDADCATRSGGGGIKEKLMRFQRVREIALKLNKPRYIEKITETKAKEMLVEAMWDAPLIANPDINEMLETSEWNIPTTAFPPNVATQEKTNSNVPTPPTHLDPIIHSEAHDQFQNATMISDKDIIQFRHEGNQHDQEDQQISRDGFISFLQSIGMNSSKEGFLKCWLYRPEADRTVGDNHCGIKLYPREVRIALGIAEVPEDGENAEHRKLYELYRKKFNEAAQSGGCRTRRTRKIM